MKSVGIVNLQMTVTGYFRFSFDLRNLKNIYNSRNSVILHFDERKKRKTNERIILCLHFMCAVRRKSFYRELFYCT